MNNNLPILEEKGFVNKIKHFFRKIFLKNRFNETETQKENATKIVDKEYKTEFENYIKVDIDNKSVKKEYERNELFTKIRNHPGLLQSLSDEQLEMLSDFYEKKIEINKNIIEEKQAKIKRLEKAS